MKLFIDITSRRFVKSAASSASLASLTLKRRDLLPIEIQFVQRGAAVATPSGTTFSTALKQSYADTNFLALAASGVLDLNTVPLEAAFASSPAVVTALLEVKWASTGEATRTATLPVEIQNSVIIGTEGTPAAMPDGKATQAQAEAGTDNSAWMTPLRTAQAIALLAPPPTWASVTGKPATFAPSAHTHTSADITDFASAVVAVSPPVDWSSLTGKPATFAPSAHTHLKGEITGLNADLAALTASDTALGQRIDYLAANLDPAALDSIAEAAASIGLLQTQIDGKATAAQGAKADTALQPQAVNYRGDYNNGLDYTFGDVVTYSDGLLYKRVSNPNNPGYPPGHSSWALFTATTGSPAYDLWVSAELANKADAVHTHPATDITGLSAFIVASAPGLSINTTVRTGDGSATTFLIDGLAGNDPEHVLVALNGVTQTPTSDYTVSEASGTITFDAAPAVGTQIAATALGLRSVQPPIDPTLYLFAFATSLDGLTTYSGRLLNANRPALPALPETATSWTVRRSTTDAAGRVLATSSATGSWLNRETLVFA
jgi:hypothetical protein